MTAQVIDFAAAREKRDAQHKARCLRAAISDCGNLPDVTPTGQQAIAEYIAGQSREPAMFDSGLTTRED